ncbi:MULTISPECIES: hypothetical protein [Agrobacterium]|uniref:hypothetical protein n=1 Tax=Agrobacterium TaxID=357 RepID=UPI0009B9A25F|nr:MULTISPECIES: hypothetical protein [Agrobacterium]QCL72189.1 hypothetical protein CFBP5499_01190 [Agrobacterium tumefaciens]CUX23136.1 hypothetical protein AGR6A_Cc150090 [Agrobacterium sp. NCPPB 925]
MKYYAPYGSTDPDASYVDKDIPGAVRGSAVPAKAIEKPQREIVDFLVKSGLAPAEGLQLSQAVQAGKVNFAATAGTGNAIVATLAPAPDSLFLGLIVRIKIATINTGPATINLNGFGVKPIKTASGDDIVAGDLKVNSIIEFAYDGANWRMLATSPQSIATRALASGTYSLAAGAIPNSIVNLTTLATVLLEDFDNSGSLSGGIFTVPYDGVAHMSISLYQPAALVSAAGLGVLKNSVLVDSVLDNSNAALDRTIRIIYNRLFSVSRGDQLQFGVACRNAAGTGNSPPITGTATIMII